MAPDRPALADVTGRGVPGRLALSVFVVAFAALVAVGVLGKGSETPGPRTGEVGPLSSATPLASLPWASSPVAEPTPSPESGCVTPTIVPLAGPIARHPLELVPTGIETVGFVAGGVDSLVADHDGGTWATSNGRLLRFDAAGRLVNAWSFEDDPGLVGVSMFAARGGGVWLSSGRRLSLFDGHRYLDVVDLPGAASGGAAAGFAGMAEGPDGSLWATIPGKGLFHWDGRLWMPVCGSTKDSQAQRIAVDRVGRVWVSFGNGWDPSSYSPARYDGRAWVSYPGPATNASEVVATADGSVWAISNGNLLRFDGASWRSVDHAGIDLSWLTSVAMSSDGSVWAVGSMTVAAETETGCCSNAARVLRYDGARWTAFGQAAGLPAPTPDRPSVNAVAVAGDVAFAGAPDGLYRLDGGRWSRTWAPDPSPQPMWIASILGVSANEAWATGDAPGGSGLWHLEDGRWTKVAITGWAPQSTTDWSLPVAQYRAGTLAVASQQGLAVLVHGAWTILAGGTFVSVAVAGDGQTVYAVGHADGAIVAATFKLSDGRWSRTDLEIESAAGNILAVDPGGTWWYTQDCSWSTCRLESMTGGRTTEVMVPGMGKDPVVGAIQTTAWGDVWALLQSPSDQPDQPGATYVARYRDGAWQTTGAAQGLVGGWSSQIEIAPDGSVWVAGDGLWRYDGTRWTAVRPGWFWGLDFAPDGTAWALEASGVAKLPADVVHPRPLSDAAATWCATFSSWSAVHAAAIALGIDEAAIDARTSMVLEARRPGDHATFAQVRRFDGEYARACEAAFSGRH